MHLKLLLILSLPLSALAEVDDASAGSEKWDNWEHVDSISLGEDYPDSEKVTIRLLEPEPITGEGKGGSSEYSLNTASHGFVFISDGDLYIDNQYAGRFTRKDDLVFGNSRLWSNGVPCTLKPLTDAQIKVLYPEGGGVYEPDGTKLVHDSRWKIYLKPGGAGGGVDYDGEDFYFSDGMTMIRVVKGRLIVSSLDYGAILRDQTIIVCDGVVSVAGEVRSPQAISRMRKPEKRDTETKPNQAEDSGGEQPANSPETK